MNKVNKRVLMQGPPRSRFDLSHEKKFDCDMGQIIPVMCDEVVPGDVFTVGNEIVIRMRPMVAPVLHSIWCRVHYFFVPYRLLWTSWEDFITGGEDGTDTSTLPTWVPTGAAMPDGINDNAVGSLWDYFGFPVGVLPTDAYPLDFPKRAYNLVWNEWYRDQISQTALTVDTSEHVQHCCWPKDYFTSALPSQQKGTAPALPITLSGTINVIADDAVGGNVGDVNVQVKTSSSQFYTTLVGGDKIVEALEKMKVDLSEGNAPSANIDDLRTTIAVQRWLEKNNRGGARYTEWLRSHYGVAPRDDRLDRPEYLGGSKQPIIVSEVLQTSETNTTAQGEQAGHGISANSARCCKYHVTEFGLIMGLMTIVPDAVYEQGIDRQWLRSTRYDFYNYLFADLSEQPVERAEIYASNTGSENTTVFGYQGRYNEMRMKRSMICGTLRDSQTFDHWHLSRQFASAPVLGDTFLKCDPRKDIFAAPTEPGFLVNVLNRIDALRPMPVFAQPGVRSI